jgi:hypothetical protein
MKEDVASWRIQIIFLERIELRNTQRPWKQCYRDFNPVYKFIVQHFFQETLLRNGKFRGKKKLQGIANLEFTKYLVIRFM